LPHVEGFGEKSLKAVFQKVLLIAGDDVGRERDDGCVQSRNLRIFFTQLENENAFFSTKKPVIFSRALVLSECQF
jgi:hypothetical protein